jgi:hypothetical protein
MLSRQLSQRRRVALPLFTYCTPETPFYAGQDSRDSENATNVTALDLSISTAARTPANDDTPFRQAVEHLAHRQRLASAATFAHRVADLVRPQRVDAATVLHASRSY